MRLRESISETQKRSSDRNIRRGQGEMSERFREKYWKGFTKRYKRVLERNIRGCSERYLTIEVEVDIFKGVNGLEMTYIFCNILLHFKFYFFGHIVSNKYS